MHRLSLGSVYPSGPCNYNRSATPYMLSPVGGVCAYHHQPLAEPLLPSQSPSGKNCEPAIYQDCTHDSMSHCCNPVGMMNLIESAIAWARQTVAQLR